MKIDKSIIRSVNVSLLKAPLIQSFTTALGSHRSLENILFQIKLIDGTQGLGEAAVATHITGETIQETKKNLEKIGPSLVGRKVLDYQTISKEADERWPQNKSALAAVQMALLDAFTRQKRIPLWKMFGRSPQEFQTDITIVISSLKVTKESAKRFYAQGFRAFKIKIGRDYDLDIKRVLAVKERVFKSDIYLDANQGYSAHMALRFLKDLRKFGVRPVLIEQPVSKNDWEGLKKITRESDVSVCADESVQSLDDAWRLVYEKAARAINIKLMKCGFFEVLRIARFAKTHHIKLMIGGMMETSLSMTASAHLAAGLGCFDFIDLDTPFFIKGALKENPYLNRRGVYDLKKVKAGIGIIP